MFIYSDGNVFFLNSIVSILYILNDLKILKVKFLFFYLILVLLVNFMKQISACLSLRSKFKTVVKYIGNSENKSGCNSTLNYR